MPRRRGRRDSPRAPLYRRRAVFGGGCDAQRLDFLCRVIEEVISAGCTTVNLPDTVGYSTPDEIGEFFRPILDARAERRPRDVQRALPRRSRPGGRQHAGRRHARGARQVECTINGIGERAGNASLEEIVMATRVRADLPAVHDRHRRRARSIPSSQLLTALTGEAVQANKAIVGRNAFAHEAGIHQDGMLKDRRTYEIMRPEEVGVPQATLVLGKHSGRHAVQRRCEQLGLTLERHELETVYWDIMSIADREKVVSDRDLADVDRAGSAASVRPPAHPPASIRLQRNPRRSRLRARRLTDRVLQGSTGFYRVLQGSFGVPQGSALPFDGL